ncbi:GntR family transcriptional regulator [Streptomyces sp. NPDC021098]|uniref:GntR family transcriptional regulator n=1 Tax=unclassified Streptomyces TaxID=2593676 RepID=UPI0037A92C96
MAEPRYATISEDLVRRIAVGRWAVGDLLPTEPELAAEYGVSRETLRRALRRVESLGLISRRKGTGTRVERSTPVTAFAAQLGSVEELAQYGRTAVRHVLSVDPVTVDEALAGTTGLPVGSRQVCITSTRQDPDHADEALSWARVYVSPEDAKAIAGDLGMSTPLISDLILARTGRAVKRVVQRVRATLLSPEAAAALGEQPGGLGMELTRRYYDESGALFEVAVSTHAGDRFVYETVLERR